MSLQDTQAAMNNSLIIASSPLKTNYSDEKEKINTSVIHQISHLKSKTSRKILHKAFSTPFEQFNELSNLEVSSSGIICQNSNTSKSEFKQANLKPEAFSEIEKDIKL